jgi:hypothetical protein
MHLSIHTSMHAGTRCFRRSGSMQPFGTWAIEDAATARRWPALRQLHLGLLRASRSCVAHIGRLRVTLVAPGAYA